LGQNLYSPLRAIKLITIGDNMNRKDFIQFRTYIDQAKKIYGLVRINKEYQEGEYIRLNKKDLLDRLDTYHLEYKEDMPLDVNTFKFYTKDKKVFYFNDKWLGRPEEVWID
tara:strand:+ start:25 stop:357 length:333 start_codon:yes stop_codon:yes gene_type:complete